MKKVKNYPCKFFKTVLLIIILTCLTNCQLVSTPVSTPTPVILAEPTKDEILNRTIIPVNSEFFVSETGSDDGPGTQAAPWHSIQKAADSMASGNSVTVLPGDYPEFVTIEHSNLSFKAGGLVRMKGFLINGENNLVKGFTITSPGSNFGIRVIGNNNRIENNDISNTSQDGIWFFGSGSIFSGNKIHDIVDRSKITTDPHVDCFQTWGPAENIIFEKNICDHTNTFGSNQITQISNVNQPVKDITFRNNLFIMHDPGYSPMTFYHMDGKPDITNIVVANNTFVHVNGIGTAGIWFRNISSAIVVNNLFIDFGDQSSSYLLTDGSRDIQISSNVVYKTDHVVPAGGMLSNDTWLPDPGLVDEKLLNFRPAPYSALVDKGMDASQWVSDDFDGTPRPQGKGFDIGAFEYKP
ncbi:MAG: right-handed parallel beta-helix repeat-containing protein [Chloroflexota bacterium]